MRRVMTHPGVAQIEGRNGGVISRHRDGTFHMSDEAAKRAVSAGEAWLASDMGTPVAREHGYRCNDCGFGTYFRTCSRCGGQCDREVDA